MNGAQRLLQEQAQVTNGLANISTTGFKQQLNLQRAVPLQGGAAYPTRVSTVSSTVGTHMAQGPMSETGHALDLAIQGEGWFAVQTPQGEAYTRSEEHTSELQSRGHLVCRLLLEKKKEKTNKHQKHK